VGFGGECARSPAVALLAVAAGPGCSGVQAFGAGAVSEFEGFGAPALAGGFDAPEFEL